MRIVHQVPGAVSAFPPAFHTYSQAVRLLNDITARHVAVIVASLGGDPTRILEVAGYGVASPPFLKFFKPVSGSIKSSSIVLPCRNAKGEIVALHDHRLQWFTQPQVHIANAVRAPWSLIEVCETTSQADSLALSANICVIARNGCDNGMVAAAVLSARRTYGSYTIKKGKELPTWEVAA